MHAAADAPEISAAVAPLACAPLPLGDFLAGMTFSSEEPRQTMRTLSVDGEPILVHFTYTKKAFPLSVKKKRVPKGAPAECLSDDAEADGDECSASSAVSLPPTKGVATYARPTHYGSCYHLYPIRCVECMTGTPLICLNDLCSALGYKRGSGQISNFERDLRDAFKSEVSKGDKAVKWFGGSYSFADAERCIAIAGPSITVRGCALVLAQSRTSIATQERIDEIRRELSVITGAEESRFFISSADNIVRLPFVAVNIKDTIARLTDTFKPKIEFPIGKYSVDIYYPSIGVAVEIDEGGHRSYKKSDERDRQQAVEQYRSAICPLSTMMMRYNPDDSGVSLIDFCGRLISLLHSRSFGVQQRKHDNELSQARHGVDVWESPEQRFAHVSAASSGSSRSAAAAAASSAETLEPEHESSPPTFLAAAVGAVNTTKSFSPETREMRARFAGVRIGAPKFSPSDSLDDELGFMLTADPDPELTAAIAASLMENQPTPPSVPPACIIELTMPQQAASAASATQRPRTPVSPPIPTPSGPIREVGFVEPNATKPRIKPPKYCD